jgi:acyl dehydratase
VTRLGVDFDSLNVGDALPAFQAEPISRLALALYCGASGDHNPIHVDVDFARAAGQPDVFAHGMLSMAYLARLLTHWVPQQALRQFGVRFVAITHVGDRITCRGSVVEKFEVDGERRVRLELSTADADGRVKLSGEAVVALP